MVHYTCDLCGHALSNDRYIVKLEVLPAPETGMLSAADLDVDHLQEVSEMLDDDDVEDAIEEADPFSAHYKQFDLCAECRRQFVRDPLGRGPHRRFKFSGN